MINGDVNEFVDYMSYGAELIFMYRGQKFFLQGMPFTQDTLCLDRWEPPGTDYIWVAKGKDGAMPVEEFLNAKLWDGRNFWEAEYEMEWVDG